MFGSISQRADARTLLASVVLAVTVLACGGSDQGSQPGAAASDSAASVAPDGGAAQASVLASEGGLCEMLPLDQVESALGAEAVSAEARKSTLGLGHSCRIIATDERILDITRSEEETLGEFTEAFEAVGLTDEPIQGLGEVAYRAPGTALGGPGARLAVYTGERHIDVTVYAEGDQAVMFDATEAIVRSLLEQGL